MGSVTLGSVTFAFAKPAFLPVPSSAMRLLRFPPLQPHPNAMSTPPRRWPKILLITATVLIVVFFIAQRLAAGILKAQIEKALGPHGEVKEISVGLSQVEIVGLRLPAPPAGRDKETWPAPDLLRAERVQIKPALSDLLSGHIGIASIRIEGAYLSMLRTHDQKLKVLPGLTDAPPAEGKEAPSAPLPEIRIGRVELADGAIEFFDASIQRPPLKLRLEQIDVRVDDIVLPELKAKSGIAIRGVLKGPKQDGTLEITGHAVFASKDSDIKTQLRGVDLLALRPYLMRATETGIRHGNMDLDAHSTVKNGHLHSPGTLTLRHLELSGNGSFMGVSQSAVVGMLKDKNGVISVDFSLDGDLNDPHFSLNEQLLGRVGAGLADALGISLGGLTQGVGSAGKGIVQGVGQGLGKLFGK